MSLPLFIVDAFTSQPFAGNPAAVVMLKHEIPDELMAKIAAEMNLSETAFVLANPPNRFVLRWFTPRVEVSLCGHATIATAHVLFSEYGYKPETIEFETLSGILRAARRGAEISLDFPLDNPLDPQAVPAELLSALGLEHYVAAFWGQRTNKLVFHVEDELIVRALKPDFQRMSQLALPEVKGVGVTAPGKDKYDFVSRYFNPWAGINEDPVTGSVHTLLAPYWSKLLGKNELFAFQASARGGELRLFTRADGRVDIRGGAVLVVRGDITP